MGDGVNEKMTPGGAKPVFSNFLSHISSERLGTQERRKEGKEWLTFRTASRCLESGSCFVDPSWFKSTVVRVLYSASN